MANFRIDVVSDTVCPWCYIGKKRLERAIASFRAEQPDATFTISWKPYYLDPKAPKVGIDKTERYVQKFGSAERVKFMQERVTKIAAAEGLSFKNGGKTGNTRDSHRLIQLGKTKNEHMQTRVIEELFAGYFENEQDITDHEFLTRAGVQAGLDEAEVKDWLASDKGGKEVDREVLEVAGYVQGVPNFTIQGKYSVDGAQDPDEFLNLFNTIQAREG